MTTALTVGDIYTFKIKRKLRQITTKQFYFPQEIFQIIKDYTGIYGLKPEQIKFFNSIGIKTLCNVYEDYFGVYPIHINSSFPALKKRKFVLNLLYSRFNKPKDFSNIYNLYISDYRDYWINNNAFILNREYRVIHVKHIDIFGIITKITRTGFEISPFKYRYEIIDIIVKRAIKIVNNFSRYQLLPPIKIDIRSKSFLRMYEITDENRNQNYCVRLPSYEIPENEKHLIRYD
tara:strand:- start:821 stop:1519 length:699 start_codon:yes stop_codon:yes gene_type:complete